LVPRRCSWSAAASWCGIAPLHHAIEAFAEGRGGALTGALLNGVAGVVAGAVVLALVSAASKLWRARSGADRDALLRASSAGSG
jgi:hypothetical protein